ncbi:MAG: cell division protein FtsQ/DivIB [bacterium]|nr:cell division protein FtsQ/DivIB [bacterium]
MAIVRTKRQQKLAVKRMISRLVTSAVLGILIVGCFLGYDYLTKTERLSISKVEFTGLTRLDAGELEPLVADMPGQNILVVPLERYTARFDGHPRIARAEFKRILPNRVVCKVEEREPVALVYTNKFVEVDRSGMIMTVDRLTDMLDLPIITGLLAQDVPEGRVCTDPRLKDALGALSVCKRYGAGFADDISELRIETSGLNIVSLKDAVVLRVGGREYETRLKRFFLMKGTIESKKTSTKVIDLRFDDQVVLRAEI